MTTHTATVPAAIRRKWDAIAIPQLCAELLRQDTENSRLQLRDGDADHWFEQLMSLQEQFAEAQDLERGLTIGGDLVLIHRTTPTAVSPPGSELVAVVGAQCDGRRRGL